MKNKINVFNYTLFSALLIVLLNDYLTYFFNIPYLISILISFIIFFALVLFYRKKIKFKFEISKCDIIFFLLLFAIFCITIVYPDRNFDTLNYHLYLQENPFGDKIFTDFFAGKAINSFSFAFPDRVFYLFRFILGYRLGTIFNYLLMIIIYQNIKDIFRKILNQEIDEMLLSIISMMIAFSISIVNIIDSYYVDLLSCALLLIAFNYIFFDCKVNLKQNNLYKYVYIAMTFGFIFVVKLSNAPFIIFFFILFLIRNPQFYKDLNIKKVVLTVLTFLFVIGLYIYYTYKSTGNPFFPFYNTIFHSKYYLDENWLDTRFGPHRLLGALIWPVIIIFQPLRAIDSQIVEPFWLIGYLSSIIIIIYEIYYSLKNHEISLKLKFGLIAFLSYFIWAKFELGYIRYGLITIILGGICFGLLIQYIIHNKKYLLLGIVIISMIWNYTYSFKYYFLSDYFWIYNNYFNNSGKLTYFYNFKKIFSHCDEKIDLGEGNNAWGIVYYNAGLAQMLNDDMPIINLTAGATNDYTKTILNDEINNFDHIYSLVDTLDLNNYINELNGSGYKIIKNVDTLKTNYLKKPSDMIYIFELQKCNAHEACSTSMDSFNSNLRITYSSVFLGLGINMINQTTDNFKAYFYDDSNKLLKSVEIPSDGTLIALNFENSKEKNVIVKDVNGKIINYPWLLIIGGN